MANENTPLIMEDDKYKSKSASMKESFLNFLDSYFKITERDTSIWQEVRAGLVTFLTMSYIVFVNPQILVPAGITRNQAASATCLAAAVASAIAGIFGNLPFGCAPGIGLSAYFTYGLVLVEGPTSPEGPSVESVKTGLTIAMTAGLIALLCWITTISRRIMRGIPDTIKIATIVGMGLFLAFVGFWNIRLVTYPPHTGDGGSAPVTLGDLSDWKIWLSLLTLVFIAVMSIYDFKGYLLIGVIACSLVYFIITGAWPKKLVGNADIRPVEDSIDFTLLGAYPHNTIVGVISFVLILIFDVSGCVFAIGEICGLMNDDGEVEGGAWALFAAAIGTILSAAMGGSPIIVHLESAAGALEGGRTGITALTVSFLFAISTFLSPLFGAMPMAATAPVLVFVGTLMMKQTAIIDWERMHVAVPAFLTIIIMPYTFSIANGIFFGLGTHIALLILTGRFLPLLGCQSCMPEESLDECNLGDEIADKEGFEYMGGLPRGEEKVVADKISQDLSGLRALMTREQRRQLDDVVDGLEDWLAQNYFNAEERDDASGMGRQNSGYKRMATGLSKQDSGYRNVTATAGGSSFSCSLQRSTSFARWERLNDYSNTAFVVGPPNRNDGPRSRTGSGSYDPPQQNGRHSISEEDPRPRRRP